MHVSFTLPVSWLIAYAVIGFVLYVPFVFWANSFIYGNRGAFSGATAPRVIRDILVSVAIWPVVLGYFIREEYKRITKGY